MLYAVVGAATVGAWLVLFHFLARNPRLLRVAAHARFFADERRRAWIGLVAYAFVALAALAHPVAGLVLACLLPVFYAVTSGGMPGGGRDVVEADDRPEEDGR